MIFFILWLNMPGFGKAGISFLICIRLGPFALIVQGLAEKIPQRSEDDFFSQPVRRTALLDQGQKATFAGKKQKCGTLLDSKVENLYPANPIYPPNKIRQGKSVFKRFLGPFILHWTV